MTGPASTKRPGPRRAVAAAFFACVQLAAALTAGVAVAGGGDLLVSASTAVCGVVLLVNRWYFRGWREYHGPRRK